jgi:hypothetical protein
MLLPTEYIMLRQPRRVCEVAFISHGIEEILFAGGRVPAKRFLAELRAKPEWQGVRAFNHKENGRGSIVEIRETHS